MRILSGLRRFAWLALGLMVAVSRLEAQNLALSITASPSPVGVSNNLTYTINVTNMTASAFPVFVTNTFPASAQLRGASITLGTGAISTNANGYSFTIALANGTPAQMTVLARPTQTGSFTNTIAVFVSGVTNFTTNMVTDVTNSTTPTTLTDLAVAMTGPASQVFSNDWMVYGVNVTNLGPGIANSVMLTNTLPPGVGYKSVSSSNQSFTVSVQKSNIIFNLSTLTNGAFANFQLTVQPTNAGTWTFLSVISTNNVDDTNSANNSASTNVTVSNFLSDTGQLTATIVSTQKFNQLSGRLEQNIVLSNAGPTSVDSARVMVTGLTNRLSNAVGTNNGNPFVTYAADLAASESVYLLLQFYPNQSAFLFTNSQLQAVGVTMPDLTPAAGLTPTNVALIVKLPSGGMLLAFPSLTNRTYTVEYSSNLLSTNWLVAQPLTWTPANYTYWIDYGPPETVRHPTNTPMRFYRVFLNP